MNTELVINLWAIFDGSTGFVYGLAGKAYNVPGTERQKLDLLKALSATDHVTAKRYKVPERFSVSFTDGSSESGITYLNSVYTPYAQLFEDVFKSIEQELPPIFNLSSEDCGLIHQAIPQDPLCVTTVLYEDEVGNIRPIITDEDREWVRLQEELAHGSDNACSEESESL
ncbi:hypothetical protein [Pseudomonas cavernicola]|nr:hypothetical protein [Pseudomonas cavernicola]